MKKLILTLCVLSLVVGCSITTAPPSKTASTTTTVSTANPR